MDSNVFWVEHGWLHELAAPRAPSILAIGDSWFWYPMPGGNLLTYLGPEVARKERVIFAIGNNGAEAVDYVDGKHSKTVRHALKFYGSGLSEVFISGGGNDFAGFSDLLPLLRSDCTGAATAEECFLPGPGWPSLAWLMTQVATSYSKLFGVIRLAAPHARIYLHNYDIAYPDGRGTFGPDKGWIRPALVRAKVPEHLYRDCVRYVLENLTSMQDTLVENSGGLVVQVNSHGVLAKADWANEMHPSGAGFEKIVRKAWRPVLQRNGAA